MIWYELIYNQAFNTYQEVFEPLGSHPPIQAQIFSEEASNVLPPPVGHEARHCHLSHVGIHKGHSCSSLCNYKRKIISAIIQKTLNALLILSVFCGQWEERKCCKPFHASNSFMSFFHGIDFSWSPGIQLQLSLHLFFIVFFVVFFQSTFVNNLSWFYLQSETVCLRIWQLQTWSNPSTKVQKWPWTTAMKIRKWRQMYIMKVNCE